VSAVPADGRVRIGIDIGGTFTDLLLVDDTSGAVTVVKTLTTPADPSNAVDAGVREALAAAGTPPALVGHVIHGTTLVTNAIIERKGDPTALITTKGFRDTLEIRTTDPVGHDTGDNCAAGRRRVLVAARTRGEASCDARRSSVRSSV
jgi:N-methylhydantoinase A/oxoprolinase/acetone carboxylase beta subunit